MFRQSLKTEKDGVGMADEVATMQPKTVKREKIQRGSVTYYKAIIALFIGSLVAFGAEYCVQPIIPVLARDFSLEPTTASLAVSFGTGGMAVAMLFIAGLAHKLRRRQVMVLALVGSIILAMLIGISQYFQLILLMRLCQGLLLAGFPPMAVAYINEEFEGSVIGTAVGIYVSGSSIGGLVGRIILSTLTDWWSWRPALLALAVFYLILIVAFVILLPRPEHVKPKHGQSKSMLAEFSRLMHNKFLVADYLVAMIVMGSFVCVYNFISYVLLAPPYSMTQTEIGLVYLLYLLGTLSSTVMGMMADSTGNGVVISLSIVCMIGGALLSLAGPLLLKLAGIGLFTFGFFGAHSADCSWAGRLDKGDKAEISAMYMLFYYIGASTFGSIGGKFLTHWGWDGVVGFLTVLLIIGLGISRWMTTHVSKDV